jgi:dTDP-4-dehydrorhamnose reductase
MRILVTGASGLLGSRILDAVSSLGHAVGTCGTRAGRGLVALELTDPQSVASVVGEVRPDWVVHAAAIRSPETCMADPARARAVNVRGTELVTRAARAAAGRVAYVSTDYVFPGTHPPYAEDDPTRPVNLYGRTKRAGELPVLASDGGLVIRVPALYSPDLNAPNNPLGALRKALAGGLEPTGDDHYVRYFTCAEDVAAAVAFLVGRGRSGVVHLSAQRRSTKRKFLRDAARAMGFDPDCVKESVQTRGRAERPLDSHLDTTLYISLGGPTLRPYGQVLAAGLVG